MKVAVAFLARDWYCIKGVMNWLFKFYFIVVWGIVAHLTNTLMLTRYLNIHLSDITNTHTSCLSSITQQRSVWFRLITLCWKIQNCPRM